MTDPQSNLPMSETALMGYSSWQVNTDRLLPKKQLPKKHRKNPDDDVGRCHTPMNASLQPLSMDLWRRSGPKISSRVHSQWERYVQKLASHLKAHLIGRNREATKSDTQDGYPIKREDRILPTAQVKGTRLDMKPSHQSLPNLMPYGVRGNP